MQVTKGTVDEGIHAMAERKLRLDAAVLDGVTAAADGKASSTAAATVQVYSMPDICRAAVPQILLQSFLASVSLKGGHRFKTPADLPSRDARCACWCMSCMGML